MTMNQLGTADNYMVDRLTRAGLKGMSAACLDFTTPADVAAAALNILDRTLIDLSESAEPADRADTCHEITAALTELLLSHGKLPN